MFCWERAVELKRDALPALEDNGVKLLLVGIGSLESGQTFGERTGFPQDMLLVDESEETEAYKSIGTRNSQRDPSTNKQIFEGVESMWSSATTDAIEIRGRDDLNAITGNLQARNLQANDAKYSGSYSCSGSKLCFQGKGCSFGTLR